MLKRPKPKIDINDALNTPSADPASNRGREALKEGHSSPQNSRCSQTMQEKMLQEDHCYMDDTEDTPCLTHPVSTLNHYSYEDFKRRAYLEWITIGSPQHNITEHDEFR